MQNEELILANKNAKESFEQFIKLYDFAPIGYLTLSEEGSILELNYKTASLFGKEHQIKGFIPISILAGCNDYISKPINKSHLNDLIQNTLKKRV